MIIIYFILFACTYLCILIECYKHNYPIIYKSGTKKQVTNIPLYAINNIKQPQTILSNENIIDNNDMVTIYPGLTTSMFAHPMDIKHMEQLTNFPIVESFARRLYSTVEQAMIVENLGSSIMVGPKQMPALYKLLLKCCKILDMDIPDLYIKQNPTPNAYTLAYKGRKPFIVIHTGLLDIMNENEVLAVIGHELGHLKCEHGTNIYMYIIHI